MIVKEYLFKPCMRFFDRKNARFDIVDTLKQIVIEKLTKLPNVEYFVDYTSFCQLRLKYAPVYLVSKRKLGQAHLNLYKHALERLESPINFVILDGKLSVDNPVVNVVEIASSNLTDKQMAVLNILNVNCDKLPKEVETDLLAQPLCCDIKNVPYLANVEAGEAYNFVLPKPYYNYIVKGKKNKVEVMDIFNKSILKLSGHFVAKLHDRVLTIRATKNNQIQVSTQMTKNAQQKLDLLKFELKTEVFVKEIELLKAMAINSLSCQLFIAENQQEKFSAQNLQTFFKVANMRKNYFNDYIFLLQDIFGIKLDKDILVVNPSDLINFDFAIHYSLNDNDYLVKYSHISGEKVKLNYVGHKLGHQDNYILGF